MGKVALAAFAGKVLATLFIAVCIGLGFGPDKWAAMILGFDPGILARSAFLLLAAATLAVLLWPLLQNWLNGGILILLPEAASRAYEQTRAADTLDMGGPAGRIGYHINALFIDAEKGLLEIYGRRPPSEKPLRVPIARLQNNYNQNANAIYAILNDPTRLEYDQLSVRQGSLRKHISRWQKTVAEHVAQGGRLVG